MFYVNVNYFLSIKQIYLIVLLKLECLQPSGSFKIRGIGATCQKASADGATRLVCSSGGNAGAAAAYAAEVCTSK
jgi:threonine dehydratase